MMADYDSPPVVPNGRRAVLKDISTTQPQATNTCTTSFLASKDLGGRRDVLENSPFPLCSSPTTVAVGATLSKADATTKPTSNKCIESVKSSDCLSLEPFSCEEDDELAYLPGAFGVPVDLVRKLYKHQRDGVAWMWSLHERNPNKAHVISERHRCVHGGILADDMGMGKTLQVATFVSGLFHSEFVETVLIICPASLLPVWQTEFSKWCPEVRVKLFHGSEKQSEAALRSVRRKGGVVLTTYGMCTSRDKQLGFIDDAGEEPIKWDMIILDEGHKIKNPATQIYKTLMKATAGYRLVITGTPVQNNLDELWALTNFFSQGQLLGAARSFTTMIASKIIQGRDKNATAVELEKAALATKQLQDILAPFLLRREKTLLTSDVSAKTKLSDKAEIVVWTTMVQSQIEMYEKFLQSDIVTAAWNRSASPLAALVVLKKIATHPVLISQMDHATLALAAAASEDDAAVDEGAVTLDAMESVTPSVLPPVKVLLGASGKLQCFVSLIHILLNEGHRTLVFSPSKRMLDVLATVLQDDSVFPSAVPYLRIDGDVIKPADRQAIVDRFNKHEKFKVCLLTTGVGSLGLTLTGADRVIIFDPTWNPAVEQQAVDRAYRVGQTKDVLTYRLISCGTVEEKMYRKQVFKVGLTASVIQSSKTPGKAQPGRFLSAADLTELFTLGKTEGSITKEIFDMFDFLKPNYNPSIQHHISTLASSTVRCFAGVSAHDLLFSIQEKDAAAVQKALVKAAEALIVSPVSRRRSSMMQPPKLIAPVVESINLADGTTEVVIDLSQEEAGTDYNTSNSNAVSATPGTTDDTELDIPHAYASAPSPLASPAPSTTTITPRTPTYIAETHHSPMLESIAVSSTVCDMHAKRLAAAGVDLAACGSCSCALSPGSVELVEFAVVTAAQVTEHSSRDELLDAIETTLDALTVCDGIAEVHKATVELATKLGWC